MRTKVLCSWFFGVFLGLVSLPEAQAVVINEFMADNDTITAPAGVKADWVELYNTTGSPVSLAGMYLSDNAGNPAKWQFPPGTSIAANGYLVVWAYDTTFPGSLHASWSLSASGEHIRLSNEDLSVVDSVTFGAQLRNRTMARIPNGTGAFTQGIPTLGETNASAVGIPPSIPPQSVVINEVMADNDTITAPAGVKADWVELYNTTGSPVSLAGMYLSDNRNSPAKWQFPPGTTIAPNGYLVVWAYDTTFPGSLHASWSLAASGEHVRLSNGDLSMVDSVTFGTQTVNRTWARVPNATGSFAQGIPTLGMANAGATDLAPSIPVQSVVINEFMADNDTIVAPAGVKADWVELYNTTGSPVSLAGMYLSDNAGNPAKWQFPPGTTIAASGYLVVWAYDTTFPGSLHASWSLTAGGEHVRLSNGDLSVVDSVTFGAQTINLTMARIPNGTGSFVQDTPTLGAQNGNIVSLRAGESRLRFRGAGELELGHAGHGRMLARFSLASPGRVRLSVFDARGREVAVLANGPLAAGTHAREFDAGTLPAGTYWFRLRTGGTVHVRAHVILP